MPIFSSEQRHTYAHSSKCVRVCVCACVCVCVRAVQKGPCDANQIAYTNIGSAGNLAEQGLDLRITAKKTLLYWLLPNPTTRALKASSRPDAVLFLPSTVCSSRVTTWCTRKSKFQQLAEDKNINPNQGEVHLIEPKLCEDTRPDPQLERQKHSTASLSPTCIDRDIGRSSST